MDYWEARDLVESLVDISQFRSLLAHNGMTVR